MTTLRTWLRDWWRGYSGADVSSLAEKMKQPMTPSGWFGVTPGEMKAIQAGALRGQSVVETDTIKHGRKQYKHVTYHTASVRVPEAFYTIAELKELITTIEQRNTVDNLALARLDGFCRDCKLMPSWTKAPIETGAYWFGNPGCAKPDIVWVHAGIVSSVMKTTFEDLNTVEGCVKMGYMFWGPIERPPA